MTNKKKGEALAERMSGKSITQLSSEFDQGTLDTIRNVNFGTQLLPGIGDEPDVIGRVVGMQVGDVSAPIVGRSGVYVVEVIKNVGASAAQNFAGLRQQGSQRIANAASQELLEALRKNADVSDLRSNFY